MGSSSFPSSSSTFIFILNFFFFFFLNDCLGIELSGEIKNGINRGYYMCVHDR